MISPQLRFSWSLMRSIIRSVTPAASKLVGIGPRLFLEGEALVFLGEDSGSAFSSVAVLAVAFLRPRFLGVSTGVSAGETGSLMQLALLEG